MRCCSFDNDGGAEENGVLLGVALSAAPDFNATSIPRFMIESTSSRMRSLSAAIFLVAQELLLVDLTVAAEDVPTLCLPDVPSKLTLLEVPCLEFDFCAAFSEPDVSPFRASANSLLFECIEI